MRRPATGGEAARARRGQAMTEFGLVLPLILLIFMGVVELGMILHDYLTQVSANAAAARYGARNFGVASANERIIDRFLGDRGHLNPALVSFRKGDGSALGSFIKTGGSVTAPDGSDPGLAADTFFMWDGDTPDATADDVPISCLNVRASYVKVGTTYTHPIIIPGLDIITQSSTFPLNVEHVIPVSALELNSNPDVDPSDLMGAFPITVVDQPFVIGQQYVLKGKSDEDPGRAGNFGWINLDPSQPGNKNENIAGWITGPGSPAIPVPGWIGGYTGQRNASDIRTALNPYAGKYVVIYIHDTHAGNGANLQYHEVGMALFKCESFTENTDGGGQPHLEISGFFVRRLF